MERDDVQLIHSVLSGDDEAFGTLVKKYQKSVHALAWRKIGDFHYAEEITQDTFIQAYEKLSTLKDRNQFAGWLYVITNNLCTDWLRKKKPVMQPMGDSSVKEIDKLTYERYLLDKREKEVSEHRHEIVKQLLEQLPESERTVVTLYYLGEMTTKEIGKFMGVSVNTITSRLQRARERLKASGELLINEILGGWQLPNNIYENIMRQVADINPITPPTGKPFLPWVAFSTAAVMVLLIASVSNQFLARFQEPYSYEAQSEPTIEIVDSLIVLETNAKPSMRNQSGQDVIPGKTSNTGSQIIEKITTPNTPENTLKLLPLSRWDTAGPLNIIISPNGTRVAVSTYDGISVHDAHTGDAVSQFTAPAPGEMPPSKVLTFSPEVSTFSADASMLASAYGKRIYVSETATGKALAMLEEHPDSITALAISPDRKKLATADGTWTVRLWEISTGKYIRSLTGHPDQVNALAFSPDSKTLASAGGTLRIWDITTGELRHAPDKDLGSIDRISFSPDGKLLATGGGWDFTAHLWDVNTGNLLKPLKSHTGEIRDIAFSPDGHTLATASVDKTLTLWDVNTRSLRHRFPAYIDREKMLRTRDIRILQTANVSAVKFSQDGERLVIASRWGTLHFYDVKIGQYSPTYLDLKSDH